MLRMSWYCSDCDSNGTVSPEDLKELMGCCPKCMHHKGNVEYYCDMTLEEYLNELYNMSAKDKANYSNAISECAHDLLQNL